MPSVKFIFLLVTTHIPAYFGCENSIFLPLIKYCVTYNGTYRQTLRSKTITSSSGVSIEVVNELIPKLCCSMINFTQELDGMNFDRCGIKEIEACFSEHIRDIKHQLTIVNNRITTIKKHTFKNLSVRSIVLLHNFIKSVEDAAFNHLPHLEQLNLSNNRLKNLNPNAFKETPNLRALFLYCNDIMHLEEKAFAFAQHPNIFITLASNGISKIDRHFLKNLPPQIRLALDLTDNNIKRLGEDIFSNHVFAHLELLHNPLVEVDTNFCRNCTIEWFTFSCEYLDNNSADFLLKWIEIYEIDVVTGKCPQYNFTQNNISEPTKCEGCKTDSQRILLAATYSITLIFAVY